MVDFGIGILLCTDLLVGLNWTVGVCLRFRSVWLRNLQTWSYFNLTGSGLGNPFTVAVTYPRSSMRGWSESTMVEVNIVCPLY